MAKTKAKSIDKKSNLLSANDDKYLIADNKTLPILSDTHFHNVAASNQQATTRNPFAINPGDEVLGNGNGNGIEYEPEYEVEDASNGEQNHQNQPINGIYYRYTVQADGLDQSTQTLGPQLVNGYLTFLDASNNITASLDLYSIEYTPITRIFDYNEIFTSVWLTDYGQWTYKVTTDDGMDMTITMNQVGFATHLVNVDYEVDNNGNPVGVLPDFGTPWLVNPTVEDVEAIKGIVWTPTTITNAAGITKEHMVFNGTDDPDYLLVTKFNAIVNTGGGSDNISGSKHNDIINGGAGDDVLVGHGGNDIIRGGEGNDDISGGAGNDVLYGGAGNDVFSIYSSTISNVDIDGYDTITGGSGSDTFIFGISSLPTAFFTITDFQHGQDTIQIYNNYYSQNANNENIVQGIMPIAQDWNDYFLFDRQNGDLYLDVDGVNGVDAVLIAKLIGVTSISGADFS